MYQDLGCVVSSSRDLEGGGGGARGRRRGVTDNLKRMGLDIGDEVWCVGVGVDSRPIIMRRKKKLLAGQRLPLRHSRTAGLGVGARV